MSKNGQTDRKADWHKRRAVAHLEISNTVYWQCWSPRYNVSVLLLCGGCHPEGLVVAGLIKLKVKLQKLCVKSSKSKKKQVQKRRLLKGNIYRTHEQTKPISRFTVYPK